MLTHDWQKATASGDSGANCVELRLGGQPESVDIGDTKLGDDTPVLSLDYAQYRAFAAHVRGDRLD